MEKLKKYGSIQLAAYIVFFAYLLILSVGIFDLREHSAYIPYLIAIPLIIYCLVLIVTNVLISKEKRTSGNEAKASALYKI